MATFEIGHELRLVSQTSDETMTAKIVDVDEESVLLQDVATHKRYAFEISEYVATGSFKLYDFSSVCDVQKIEEAT